MAATTYTTTQGDTWDSISYQIYGAEKYMKLLIEANWPLLDVLVFSAGTEIKIPDLPDDSDEDLPPWRSDDTEDATLEEYVEEDNE